MENKVKQCKHNVKLAFNNDEIISYCDKCGKILDRYVKVNGNINYYYTYPSTTPNPNYWGPNWTCTTGDPYTPEMGSHTSTAITSDITSLK